MDISEQFKLTKLKRSDVNALVEILNDPVYSQNTSSIPYPYQTDDAQKWIALNLQKKPFDPTQVWAVRDNGSGKISGVIGLHDFDEGKAQAEVGYWVDKAHWGKGIATYALSALISLIKDGGKQRIKILVAHTFKGNIASDRVLEKNSFQKKKWIAQHIQKKEKTIGAFLWQRKL